jgi:PadR family transcriptional regulator, regulatory protein PadR
MAKRRPGYLLRLDSRVLDVAELLERTGTPEFYGLQVAKLLAEHFDGADRAATGAVYKSLARLVALGLLDERWAGRRHVYALTERGRDAIVPARMGARVFGRSARTLRRRASPRS